MSAAALAVGILPTACTYASAAEPRSGAAAATTTPAAGDGGQASRSAPASNAAGAGTTGRTAAGANATGGNAASGNAASGNAAGAASRPTPTETAAAQATTTTPAPAPAGGAANNGLDVLGSDCSASKLQPHDGFQVAPRCVETSFGEVAAQDRNPTLLITESPQTVAVGETFTIAVNTRNLVRDRFLGAAAGGYYLESSFLDGNGLQRGHFHTACRMLASTTVAPDPAPAPAFFVATQDNGGGADPDTVTITVPGMPSAGTAQCAVWAGDGSHRVPMMQRANQTPAFDAVRITVQ